MSQPSRPLDDPRFARRSALAGRALRAGGSMRRGTEGRLEKEEGWPAGVVVPLARIGCEALDCRVGEPGGSPLARRPGASRSRRRLAEFSPRRSSRP